MQQGARSARVCHSVADPGPGGGSSRPNSWGAGQPQPPPAALATAPPALVGHGDGAVIWRHSPRSESGPAASDTYRPVQRSGAAGGLASRRRYPHFPGPGRSAASSSQLLHCHLMTVSCQPDSECGHRGSAPPRRRPGPLGGPGWVRVTVRPDDECFVVYSGLRFSKKMAWVSPQVRLPLP